MARTITGGPAAGSATARPEVAEPQLPSRPRPTALDTSTAGPPWRARLLYGAVILLSPLYQLVLNGREYLSGQLWAELGSYYGTATSPSLVVRLLTTDAGYIPLPQRLLAAAGTAVGIPPSGIPYYFSAVALLGAGLLVGVLCLAPFRALIANDYLRFALAMAVLAVPDFNTKAFTNATYFAAVFAVALSALAILRDGPPVPRWAWFLPVFMLSKPIVLLTLPLVVTAAVVGRRRRFRRIALVASLFAAAQVFSVLTNSSIIAPQATSLGERIVLAAQHFLGFLGRYSTSVLTPPDAGWSQVLGAVLLTVAIVALRVSRHPATVLATGGLYLVAGTAAVDALTLGYLGFDSSFRVLEGPFDVAVDRWVFGATVGTIILIGSLVTVVSESGRVRSAVARLPFVGHPGVAARQGVALLAVVVFGLWLVLADWPARSRQANTMPGIPLTDISQWQQLSEEIADPPPVLCVPLNGNWVYGRRCTTLVGLPIPAPDYIKVTGYERIPAGPHGAAQSVDLPVPEDVTAGRLASLAVLVRPLDGSAQVRGTANLTRQDGATRQWSAQADLPAGGGLVQFVDHPARPTRGVVKVELRFDQPVDLVRTTTLWSPPDTTHVMWMGQPD